MEILNLASKIRASKHFDLIRKVILTAAFMIALHFIYILFDSMQDFLPEIAFNKLVDLHITFIIFLGISLFLDVYMYFFDFYYYKYIKRNGDRTFDEQEDFKKIQIWQKLILSQGKYFFLFYMLVSIYLR